MTLSPTFYICYLIHSSQRPSMVGLVFSFQRWGNRGSGTLSNSYVATELDLSNGLPNPEREYFPLCLTAPSILPFSSSLRDRNYVHYVQTPKNFRDFQLKIPYWTFFVSLSRLVVYTLQCLSISSELDIMAQLEVISLLKQTLLRATDRWIWGACVIPSMKGDLAKWWLEFKNHLGDV